MHAPLLSDDFTIALIFGFLPHRYSKTKKLCGYVAWVTVFVNDNFSMVFPEYCVQYL